jgi:Ca2+-binding EF-hand superfamily protein
MKAWTILFSLALACLAAGNTFAKEPPKKDPLLERFKKIDTNHDGIVSEKEFIAVNKEMGKEAAKRFAELEKLGGTTTKNKETGMAFEQFKKALEEWAKQHPPKEKNKESK